ncbi:MAG: cupin domain-containing protein [Nitrospirae bacterium]|nr:cupin domain-containing protein [Nitrospirota bacterium]
METHKSAQAAGGVKSLTKMIHFRDDRPNVHLVYDAPGLRVALFCLNAGQVVEPHVAPMNVLMTVVRGHGWILVGEDGELPVEAGDLVACRPDEPHGMRAPKNTDLVVLAVISAAPHPAP